MRDGLQVGAVAVVSMFKSTVGKPVGWLNHLSKQPWISVTSFYIDRTAYRSSDLLLAARLPLAALYRGDGSRNPDIHKVLSLLLRAIDGASNLAAWESEMRTVRVFHRSCVAFVVELKAVPIRAAYARCA